MPVSPARIIACRILGRVDDGRAFAVDLLQSREVSMLKDTDRRLATEIVMGVLRWRGDLDFEIEELSGKPMKYFDREIVTILRMAVYQIRFLERIPQSAVVNDAVELTKVARKRSAAGLVNAVLRKCAPTKSRAATNAQVCRSFPRWIRQRWETNFGPEAFMSLARASNAIPPTTLRVCCGEREEIQKELAREGIRTEAGLYSQRALIVREGNIQASEVFRRGEVIIQDEASQLVGELVAPQAGQRILDVCAAPGIKTTQLAATLREGMVIATDLSARRLGTMAALLARHIPSGVSAYLMRADATRELPFRCMFDRILVDVPCSGTGTLARNPEIKWRLQPNDLPRLSKVQARILKNALAVLALGGRLVYSTCSLEPEENEEVVEAVLGEISGLRLPTSGELASNFPKLASFFDARGYFRTRPDLHGTDGFFACVIERSGS